MQYRSTFFLKSFIFVLLMAIGSPAFALTSYARMVKDLVTLEKQGKQIGDPRLSIYSIGNSAQGRQIPLALLRNPAIPIGKTKTLFIICRQHGDEPASTEASLDFIREMTTTEDPEQRAILKKVSFFIIPMANPDGAERFTRRNANGADLNRDWVKKTQPETRAIVSAVKMYHPTVVIDAHELSPNNPTEDFVEAVTTRAGASKNVAQMNKVLQDIVLKTLKAYGQYPDRINSQSLRVPTLAHRYFPVALGVPSVLFETKQAGARAYNLQTRKEIHRSGMMAVARYLSGDNFSDIDRMLAKQISKPKSKPSRGNREMAELLGRGGKTKRWTHRAK